MKKYFVLLLLILSTQLFAEVKPTVSKVERTYILDGYIDKKYPITMYLTLKTDTILGKYYYNNVGKFIYLGESVLNKKSTITLKEYATSSDAYNNKNSTGEFDGLLSVAPAFTGTWKSGKKSFPFYLDRRDIVVDIDEYKFNEDSVKFENMSFDYNSEILQITGSKKTSSIEKINKELRRRHEFEPLYSDWKEWIKDDPNSVFNAWTFESRTHLEYIDNNILSVGSIESSYTGSARVNYIYNSATYSLSSGKKLTVSDLISDVDNSKLIALMKKQLIEYMKMTDDSYTNPSDFYEDFENIRLGDSYSVDENGITFLYDYSEISHNTPEPIEVDFTYDEIKPFVKKSSPLWYLLK